MLSSLSHKLFLYEIDFNELKENYDRYIKVNNQILQIFELEINTYNYCIENKFSLQAVFGNIRDFYPFKNFDEIYNIKNKEEAINLMLKYNKFFVSNFIRKTHIDDKKLNLKLYKKFKIKELGSSISYIKVLSNDL